MSQEIVARIRQQYPTPLGASHASFLLEVAQTLKGGLLKKTGGTVVTLPSGQTVAQDIFAEPPVSGICKCWDILQDGEGAANPVFNRSDDQPESRYYAVGTQPIPDPEPQPDPQIEARLIALEAAVSVLQRSDLAQAVENQRLDHAIRQTNNTVAEKVEALSLRIAIQEARKIPTRAKGRIRLPLIGEREFTLPLE